MMQNEIRRQALHIIIGSIYLIITLLLPKEYALGVIGVIFATGFLASLFHTNISPIPFVEDIIGNVEREKEKELKGIAALNFTLAVIISMILFSQSPKIILIGALIVLTFGDGFSTIAGKAFGKTKIGEKTLEGSLGGVIASTLALLLLFPIQTAIITAVIGMLAEFLPLEDNYTIPIVSGIVLILLI